MWYGWKKVFDEWFCVQFYEQVWGSCWPCIMEDSVGILCASIHATYIFSCGYIPCLCVHRNCLCSWDRHSSFEQHTPGDSGWMMNDTIAKRCLPSLHCHPSPRDLSGIVALPKFCYSQIGPPRTFFTNLHGASGWISSKQQREKARPWVSVVSISWWTDTTRGCCLKAQHIFIFRDVFGLHQCLLRPLFLMFHYAGDQFWQPKQSLIRTAYSLNEWSLHLLTPLTSPWNVLFNIWQSQL